MPTPPYLPDIMEGIVERVNASFQVREVDAFNVFFDKGIQAQVRKNVAANPENFPLIWLVMNYTETFGNFKVYAEVSCNLIIAMPTKPGYTQAQREENTFKPRLLPVYELLMKEIAREKWFSFRGENQISHTRTLLPYWGMGDVEGSDADNLFKNTYIDAISISSLKLTLRNMNCQIGDYPLSIAN